MKCPNCGNELLDGACFCNNCGTPITNQEQQYNQQTYAQQQYSQQQYDQQQYAQQQQYSQPQYEQQQYAQQQYVQQSYQQPVYRNEPQIPEEYQPISMWGYFGYELLFSIPCIGFILLLVFSFGGARNKNLKNFARSYFCFLIVFAIIIVLIAMTVGVGAGFGAMRYGF